jgi:hypothetical protein
MLPHLQCAVSPSSRRFSERDLRASSYDASFSSLLGCCSLPPLLPLIRYAQTAFVRSDAVLALKAG